MKYKVHTYGPDNNTDASVLQEGGTLIADLTSDMPGVAGERAERIVTALNAHEGLLKACEAALILLQMLHALGPTTKQLEAAIRFAREGR